MSYLTDLENKMKRLEEIRAKVSKIFAEFNSAFSKMMTLPLPKTIEAKQEYAELLEEALAIKPVMFEHFNVISKIAQPYIVSRRGVLDKDLTKLESEIEEVNSLAEEIQELSRSCEALSAGVHIEPNIPQQEELTLEDCYLGVQNAFDAFNALMNPPVKFWRKNPEMLDVVGTRTQELRGMMLKCTDLFGVNFMKEVQSSIPGAKAEIERINQGALSVMRSRFPERMKEAIEEVMQDILGDQHQQVPHAEL